MKQKFLCYFDIIKERISGSDITNTSVLIAFYLLLSIFPLLIVVGNILPYLHIDPATVISYIDAVVPEAVRTILDPVVQQLLTVSSGGLLSVGIIAGIWSSSKGVAHLSSGINKAYGISTTNSAITKRVLSLITVLLMLLLMAAFVIVFGFGQTIMDWLEPVFPWAGEAAKTIGDLKWPVALVFIFCLLTLVYRVTPDVKLRIRDALPGAALAAVGMLLLVQGFSLYLRFVSRSFSTYGAIGAFFVLMFWLEFTAMIIIVGAVLNASIAQYRFGTAQEEESGVDRVVRQTQNRLLQQARAILIKRKKPKETPTAGEAGPDERKDTAPPAPRVGSNSKKRNGENAADKKEDTP